MSGFAGAAWWVTGATSGLGAAIAESLAAAGARTILSGRNQDALAAAAARYGTSALALPFEATDFARIPDLVDKAWSWAGRIHGLVNNAGVSQRSLAEETGFEVYRRIVEVDLLGPIALTQALLPRMIAAGGGDVVAISSVAGYVGSPLRSAYSAAKHGLVGYHDSLRAETARHGMRVLVVAPGSVRTDVSRNALDAVGDARGFSDAAIDGGMAPAAASARILEAVAAAERELILAEGAEAELVRLRRTDPETLFDRMARLVERGYAQKLGAKSGSLPQADLARPPAPRSKEHR